MSPKRKKRRPVSSSTVLPDHGTTVDADEVTSLALPTDTVVAPLPDETLAEPIDDEGDRTESGETTGRTWADLAHPYLSNKRYSYLAVLLVIGLSLGVTGHLSTPMEQAAAGGLMGIAWLLLWFAQRR